MTDRHRPPSWTDRYLVRVSYYPDVLDDWAFCARLGTSGWYEGLGGDVDEALDELARVLADEQYAELPAALLGEPESIRRWLAQRVEGPVLGDDDLLKHLDRIYATTVRET